MSTSKSQLIQTGLGAVLTAVGTIGTIAPQRLSTSADPAIPAGESVYLTRLWTLREGALGAMLLATRKSNRRRGILGAFVTLAAAEVVLTATTPTMTGQAKAGAVGSAALFGGLGTIALVLAGRADDN